MRQESLGQAFTGPSEFLFLQSQQYLPALHQCSTWPALLQRQMSLLLFSILHTVARLTFMIDGAIEKPTATWLWSTAPIVMSVGLMSSPTLPRTAPTAPTRIPVGEMTTPWAESTAPVTLATVHEQALPFSDLD